MINRCTHAIERCQGAAAKLLVIGGGYQRSSFARAAAAPGMAVTLTRRQVAGSDASPGLAGLARSGP